MRYFAVFLIITPLVLLGLWFKKNFIVQSKNEIQTQATRSPLPTPYVITEERLWSVVNDWKINTSGIGYENNEVLCQQAGLRLKEVQNDWSHDGFNDNAEIAKKTGGFSKVGENLARDYLYESEILNEWLSSASHKKNLDDTYTHSCIKCQNNYCVQLFGKYPAKNNNNPQLNSTTKKITCTGPDNKQFQTTQEECDSFNKAWNNTPTLGADSMVRCNILANCGGGYKEMSLKTCQEMVCCELSTGWVSTSQDDCNHRQGKENKQ